MPIIGSFGAGSGRGYGQTGAAKGPGFICAEGGTVVTCGNFKTHIFTGSDDFVVNFTGEGTPDSPDGVEYLIVAGGGGGGGAGPGGGGGGAGGYRTNYTGTKVPVTRQTYPIVVGAGGGSNTNGSDSTFESVTSAGGGRGSTGPGGDGGSGGGSGGGTLQIGGEPGGVGNTPPVSPPQGNPGGIGYYSPGGNCGPVVKYRTGGGGGASAAGGNGPAGPGGNGSPISPTMIGAPAATCYGTPGPAPGRWFAGGGGGTQLQPSGGSGSGGAGGGAAGGNGACATVNTGGGGGSGRCTSPVGAGGSGIVMIRYKFQ